MKTIKSTSKLGKRFIEMYNKSDNAYLNDVYRSYSTEKFNQWYKCIKESIKDEGTGFKIISYNTFQFTVMYKIYDGYIVKTKSNKYKIEIEPF